MGVISIVLPTHNGSRYLRQSIDSCLNQTYQDWELIIVDDASTDDTPNLIAQYTDPRIRAIRHPMNRGLPAALNTGFAATRGEFLTWTSDDNYYLPVALMRMLAALRQHPEVDFVYADQDFVDERGAFLVHMVAEEPEVLLQTNPINACFLYRRRVYEAVGAYAEDLPLVEDYDYWLRVSLLFRMMPLRDTLYCYRVHSRSLTSRYGSEVQRLIVWKSRRRHLRAIPWADAATKASYCLNEARRARFEGRVADMIAELMLAGRIAPGWTISQIASQVGRFVAARAARLRGF